MKITVLGIGYVGLVTAAGLAALGHEVIGADIAAEKVATLNAGGIPLWEPGLQEVLNKASSNGRIRFCIDIPAAIHESPVCFIAVGTPKTADGSADLRQVEQAVADIGKHARSNTVVVVKSTVPPGTGDGLEEILRQKWERCDLHVVSNPEFLRQGNAVDDFFHPDRMVVGTSSPFARKVMERIYHGLSAPLQICDRRSAEMIKYASNAFLAMKISYINMIADLCDRIDADVNAVARGMGADPRIGSAFLRPGMGYGGSCFPKDTQALIAIGKRENVEMSLVEAAARINRGRPLTLLQRLEDECGGLRGRKIGVWGLTFKPMSDDLREAPSIPFCRMAVEAGAEVFAYDPLIRRDYPVEDVHLCEDSYEVASASDVTILMTEWEEFRNCDWSRIMAGRHDWILLDGRNLYSLDAMKRVAQHWPLTYLSVGRPSVRPVKSESVSLPESRTRNG
ncbi:UDP-glucose dehydrogenase family protein [Desmospora profundinema]|uniref:UDP-glucose 6-dehydrogenase n=1 Tax=Desmospora profundinema TaxID=1571184 RepID=A0ABU1IJI3_9BACL|nr:UDP-glucose/GDP-mannose dehydrogenase family protein [Desmospora profundinema]MDR6224921.1 UDPglucose 6-dehydrogenase [Desmospora profundinema]